MKCPKCKNDMVEIIINKMWVCPICGDKKEKKIK